MHYRVSVYNYLYQRFKEHDIEWIVRSNKLQNQNIHKLDFDFKELDFRFNLYRKEINKINPDAIILFLHLKDRIYLPLAHYIKMKKIPLIYWNKAINYDNPGNKISRFLFQHLHNLANQIILYSNTEVGHISPKNRHKVSAANNTINFADFPEITDSKEEIKKELGIPFKNIVLAVGRMAVDGGRKRIDILVDLFRNLNRKDIGLVLVGSGMTSELKNRLNPNNTIYLGEVHDPENIKISKIFKMADIFCLPEHVGLGINQAFYFGLPVVTMEGNQPPEINYLQNNRNGFIVPHLHIEELKDKILYLIDNEKIRSEFARNAKKDIIENASVENMFKTFLNCFNQIA